MQSMSKTLIQNHQFIQRSKLPTYYFQVALPKLPIPKLEQTCKRYLLAQHPLLNDTDFKRVEQDVEQFRKGHGKDLHQDLVTSDSKNLRTSYISSLWYEKYLRNRSPLPINFNPMLVLENEKRPEYNTQLIRACNLIYSSLRFHKSLVNNVLEPDIYHMTKRTKGPKYIWICRALPAFVACWFSYSMQAFPLDMSQYPNLFNSTRIPKTDKDEIHREPNGNHITVQYNGHFYAVQVIDSKGNIIASNVLLHRLKYIFHMNHKPAPHPIGVYTALERNHWANVRKKLQFQNANSLNAIDSAIFNVCLDNVDVADDPMKIARNFLHGDGSNRWFDKSFSLIITKDGVAGVNFEHSWGDGVAVLRYVQDIYKDSTENPVVSNENQSTNETATDPYDYGVQYLDISLDQELETYSIKAKDYFRRVCNDLDMNYLIYDGLGKKTCKKHNISADAMAQIAFQIAYNKVHGHFVSTYESCSTAAFRHGRTETIRPLTSKVKELVLLINNKGTDLIESKINPIQLRKMMLDCSTNHSDLIRKAASGHGFDRHLYALRNLAQLNSLKEAIFENEAYANLNHEIISTSTLNSPVLQAGGFGPAVYNGYGIGYIIRNDEFGVLVTSKRDEKNCTDFINGLREACNDISHILT